MRFYKKYGINIPKGWTVVENSERCECVILTKTIKMCNHEGVPKYTTLAHEAMHARRFEKGHNYAFHLGATQEDRIRHELFAITAEFHEGRKRGDVSFLKEYIDYLETQYLQHEHAEAYKRLKQSNLYRRVKTMIEQAG